MQTNPEVIQKLSEKADEADKKSRPWLSMMKVFGVTWVGGIALNLVSQIAGKKRPLRGFGGWDHAISPAEGVIMGGMGVTGLIGVAKQSRVQAFQESIEEMQRTPSSLDQQAPPDAVVDCKEKIASADTCLSCIKP